MVLTDDSGNDLPALDSGLQNVLVRNAHPEVREEALHIVRQKGVKKRLYIARGNFMGMKGNDAAGVLDGLVHFMP